MSRRKRTRNRVISVAQWAEHAVAARLGGRHGDRHRHVRRRQHADYPLVIAGFTLPGYGTIYSVILNIVVAVVLTPIFNALRGSKPDATVAADHRA